MGRKFIYVSLFATMILASGCSFKAGGTGAQTHFSFPNSNVEALGHVKAKKTRWSIIIPPTITNEDTIAVLNDALSQQAGSDLIINYKADTKMTTIPIPLLSPAWVTYSLEGTAAKMDIGEQELLEKINY